MVICEVKKGKEAKRKEKTRWEKRKGFRKGKKGGQEKKGEVIGDERRK